MPLTPTTLDPAAKSARITLAADELTVTAASSGYSHVRSKLAVSSGKYYVEFARSNNPFMFGVVPAGASLDMYAGGAGAGVGLYSNAAVAERKPLFRVSGRLRQLPAGDTLPPQAPAAHSHAISAVAGLEDALDAKQASLGFKITVSTTEPSSPATGDIWISY